MITLHYKFEVEANVADYVDVVDTVDYDYDVDPKIDDYIDYLLQTKEFRGTDDNPVYVAGMKESLKRLMGTWDWVKDGLEDDDEFIDFLKDRYYYKAKSAWYGEE